MQNVKDRLDLFQELIYCNYKINISCYDCNMRLISSSNPSIALFDNLLSVSHNKGSILAHAESSTYPVVVSDDFGLVWIACFEKQEDRIHQIHVLGPAYTTENSFQNLKTKIDNYDFSIRLKKMVLERLYEIPVIVSSLYFQYAIMLHYCLTNERIQNSDIQFKAVGSGNLQSNALSSDKHHHGIWSAEQHLLSMIEQGIVNYGNALSNVATLSKGVKISVGDPIRQAKDSVITFIALCSRAAIRGGLSSETSYTLADYYVQNLETTNSFTEVGIISHTMYEDFIQRVYKLKLDQNLSSTVHSCRDYIDLHVCEKIETQELAKTLGYNEYYLTKKFKKEMGISMNQYIQKRKIEHAKLLLSTSNTSIQDISDTLCFCSRSYFTDIFIKVEGCSPSDFRQKHNRS